MGESTSIKWRKSVQQDDFAAGQSYLALLYPDEKARELIRALEGARLSHFAAKDILRASELALLPEQDPDVHRQLKKIRKGEALSPLLLVRESGHARLIVADGFHRLCAAHHVGPAELIPCKIA